ncbi:MAG: sulfatase [Planctomycetes bacterium]|nr:sulfatase [Planctomycetota bacterium]
MGLYLGRREFLGAIGVTVVGGLPGSGVFAAANRPNLVFVFPDQMRGQALGFLNEDPVITPNLDAFAGESLVLPQAVSNYPVCSPYRAMLMTGKWPHANNVLSNCTSNTEPFGCELQKDDRCWSDVLKDKGYSLGYIGKWHLEAPRAPYIDCANNRGKTKWNEWCPPDRRHGFDFWYSYNTYDYHLRPLYWSNDAGRDDFHYVDQWGPEHEADLAIKYIKNEGAKYRRGGRPFALVVSMNPPHTPYSMVPKKYVDMYAGKTSDDLCNRGNIGAADTKWGAYYRKNVKNYFAMVTGVDDQFGRILEALKQNALNKDTIVVFTSDHGNCLGCNGQMTKNVHYEEAMRVPFMIRFPGRIAARSDDLLLSTPDIYPTLLDLMGLESDIPQDMQGISRAKLFLTGKGVRPDSQLYIWVPPGKPHLGRRGVRTHRYTFMITKAEGKGPVRLLHDNVKDPYQLKNVAVEQPKVAAQLEKKLKKLLRDHNDPWLNS